MSRINPQIGDKWFVEPCEDYPVGFTLTIKSIENDIVHWDDDTHSNLKDLGTSIWMRPINEVPRKLSDEEAEKIDTYFHRYTDRSKTVLNYAKAAVIACKEDAIDTHHVLYGLIKEGSGVAANVLARCGVTSAELLVGIQQLPKFEPKLSGFPSTHLCRSMLRKAVEVSKELGHKYVGTEHLLIAAVSHPNYSSYQILKKHFGIDVERVKDEVLDLLGFSTAKFTAEGNNIYKYEPNSSERVLAAVWLEEEEELPEKVEPIKMQFKDFETLQAVNYVVKERLGLETETETEGENFVLTITDFVFSLSS